MGGHIPRVQGPRTRQHRGRTEPQQLHDLERLCRVYACYQDGAAELREEQHGLFPCMSFCLSTGFPFVLEWYAVVDLGLRLTTAHTRSCLISIGSSGHGRSQTGEKRGVLLAQSLLVPNYSQLLSSFSSDSSVTGSVEAPMWSYSLGLQNGWMPTDPRTSEGTCNAAGVNKPFAGPLQPSQTGGVGAGTIAPAFVASFGQWPPATLASIPDAGVLPTYTPTGAVPTLPPPTYTLKSGATTVGGNGWANANDNLGAPVNISGCTYPDGWAQTSIPLPTEACPSPTDERRRAAPPKRTPPPIVA